MERSAAPEFPRPLAARDPVRAAPSCTGFNRVRTDALSVVEGMRMVIEQGMPVRGP